MKQIFYLGVFILLTGLSGCGTLASLENKNEYVKYATIYVTDSLSVSGRLININDSIIVISVEGAVIEYNQNNINGFQKYMAPDPELMQRDIVKNTQRSASNIGFFVIITIITTVLIMFSL